MSIKDRTDTQFFLYNLIHLLHISKRRNSLHIWQSEWHKLLSENFFRGCRINKIYEQYYCKKTTLPNLAVLIKLYGLKEK